MCSVTLSLVCQYYIRCYILWHQKLGTQWPSSCLQKAHWRRRLPPHPSPINHSVWGPIPKVTNVFSLTLICTYSYIRTYTFTHICTYSAIPVTGTNTSTHSPADAPSMWLFCVSQPSYAMHDDKLWIQNVIQIMHQQEDYFALKGVWLCLQNWLCPEEIERKKNSGSRRCNPARLILVTCKAAEKTKNKASHSSYLLNRAQISIAGHQPKQQQVCCKERRLVLAGMHTPQEWNHSPNLSLESPNTWVL